MLSRSRSGALRATLPRDVLTRRTVLAGSAAAAMGMAFAASGSWPVPVAAQSADDADRAARMMGQEIEPAAHEGGTLVTANTYDVGTFSPLNIYPSFVDFPRRLIFQSLVEPDPFTIEPVGLLAESWEASDDGLTWTFHLRDGVSWHDGEPFTAEDVKVTYDLYLNPDSGSRFHGLLSTLIASVETPDERTVVFTTPVQNVDFPLTVPVYMLGAAHILSEIAPADLNASAVNTGSDPAMVVGTGPFKFEEAVLGEQMTFVRNDDYWDGRPHLDTFIYKVVANSQAMTSQILTGEVNLLYESDASSYPELEGSDLRLVETSIIGTNVVAFNLDPERTELFQDKRVRQALLYAIDRQAIIDSVLGGVGDLPVTPMTELYWTTKPDAITVRYDYDPEQAGQLLDQAGWVLGTDGVRAKDGQPLAFTLMTESGWAPWVGFATAIQEYWRQIGVAVELQLDLAEAVSERYYTTHDYEAVIWAHGGGLTPDETDLMACDAYENGRNYRRYCNPEVDEILAQARTIEDPDERITLYTRYQNILLEDLPVLPLFRDVNVAVVDPRVHNIFPNGINTQFNAETWWMEP